MLFRITSLIILLLIRFSTSLSNNKYFRPSQQEIQNPQLTPVKSVYGIKSIQPDGWKIDDIVGNGGGGAAINYVWYSHQPFLKYAPCNSGEDEYDGQCFVINSATETKTKSYSDKGLVITGILYGVPDWARRNKPNCDSIFCAPDDGKDFGRFAGWLAKRYNGANGKGRIVEFVIHNEVNAVEWFNIGCGNGVQCNVDKWIDVYASSYNNAFDQIRKHQPKAPILISLEHHFDSSLDYMITSKMPVISGMTFLKRLVPKLGSRDWSLAFHSYPPSLLHPSFSQNDWPKITFGNVNVLIGWLIKTYPNTRSAWRVYLTENGVNGVAPYSEQDSQNKALCKAFRNIVSTPFIENFVYHRLKDHPVELAQGLGLGLVDVNNQYKKAWATWALSNRFELNNTLNCGFETLPYLHLKVGFKKNFGHFTTTRDLPSGYSLVRTFKIFREEQTDTNLLLECQSNPNNNFVSTSLNCENQNHNGPLGYVYKIQKPSTLPINRCYNPSNGDHFLSTNSNCDGQKFESTLGYALLL